MSIEVHKVRRARVNVETTFATALSLPGTFLDLPFTEDSFTFSLDQDLLNPEYSQQYKFNTPEHVLGKRSATWSFTMNLASTGTAAGSAVAQATSATNPLGMMLKAVMGGESGFTGSAVTGGTAAVPIATSASTRFGAGSVVGLTVSGATQWRPITSIASTSITLKLAASTTPTSTDCYAPTSYFFAQDSNPNDSTSLQFEIDGAEADDRFLLLGCQATGMSITVETGALARVTFTGVAADWAYNGATVTGTLGVATYAATQPVPAVTGAYYQWTNGTTTYTASTDSVEGSELHVAKETWEPGISHIPVTSPSGTQTILRFVRARTIPAIKGSFSIPHISNTQFTNRSGLLDKGYLRVLGGTPGSTVILDAPTTQVMNVQKANENELNYQAVNWQGRNDGTTAGSTDLERSPFRIHLA